MNTLPTGDIADLYEMVTRAVDGAGFLVLGAVSLRFFVASLQQILSGNRGGGWEASPIAKAIPDVMVGATVYAGIKLLTKAFWAYAVYVGGR